MTVRTPNPLFEPLLRMMSLPPALARFAPASAGQRLHTVLLRDTPLAVGQRATFDDACRLTTVEGELGRLNNLKLIVQGGAREVSGLQLTVLSTAGQIQLAVNGNNVRVFIGTGVVMHSTIHLAGQATLFVGDHTTVAQSRIIGANTDISLGDDCQVHDEVVFQCSDPHPITDLEQGKVVNAHRRSVQLGRHVLVGRRSLLLPDVRLGDGCVVNPGSVVEGNVPEQTQVGGAPASVLRPRVAWARRYGETPPDLSC